MSLQDLFDNEDRIITKMGASFLGERVVFRGKDLHHDLKDLSWFELFLYSITGRFFSEKELKLLNFLWVTTSYPDPRLWPNRVMAIAAAARSTATLALSSSIAISEATYYGRRADKKTIDFFIQINKLYQSNPDKLQDFVFQKIKAQRMMLGYGRPVGEEDERIPHVKKFITKNNIELGKYTQLAFKIEKIINQRYRMTINMAGISAALVADMGFSPIEYHLFTSPVFIAGSSPCFIDSYNKPEGCFLPMRCEKIISKDHKYRAW